MRVRAVIVRDDLMVGSKCMTVGPLQCGKSWWWAQKYEGKGRYNAGFIDGGSQVHDGRAVMVRDNFVVGTNR